MDYLIPDPAAVVALQTHLGWLAPLMNAVSFTGTAVFFFAVLPAIWWCVSPRLGLRLGLIVSLSGCINAVLKVLFHTPRPYWVSTEVRAFSTHQTFSLPSGHAQNAVCFFGAAAVWIHKRWFWAVAATLILLTGLSRIILGVHFPVDVLAGWAVGIVVLLLFIAADRRLSPGITALSPAVQAAGVTAASLLLAALGLALVVSGGEIPLSWTETAVAASGLPATRAIDPYDPSTLLSSAGTLLGIGLGAVWMGERFSAEGSVRAKLRRYALGMAIAALIYAGMGLAPDGGLLAAGWTIEYLRAAVLGFWVSGGAPALFKYLGIAGEAHRPSR
ncbi:phosphatase PAP2 family protein [Methanofollis tationis]|uniref:Phosphatase PAP2 family protein n=1 Tax=Methanofollis tationis TaxID=81417 RepID=A0A7K4HQH4_9EURY|nr:phosphatase PAP2 family protein [Methanofollis tationis]NVO67479.1 phosphatase PAP2 family protein [Methanofollis tationis]